MPTSYTQITSSIFLEVEYLNTVQCTQDKDSLLQLKIHQNFADDMVKPLQKCRENASFFWRLWRDIGIRRYINHRQTSSTTSHNVAQCATSAPTEETNDSDDIEFSDHALLKKKETHKKNPGKLNKDFRRRMNGLKNIRKRKMQQARQNYKKEKEQVLGGEAGDAYRSTFLHRGYCLIIQNSKQHEQYAESLNKHFDSNGYIVNHCKNLDKRKMMAMLQHVTQEDFSDYGSFVSFIFSPGTDKYVKTIDEKQVDIANIVKLFITSGITTLKDKPKMFFFMSEIDILNAEDVWRKDKKHGGSPYIMPHYPDAFLLISTLRDFPTNFTNCLLESQRKTLYEVLDTVARFTMPLASEKEQYQITSTLSKEVYLGKHETML